MSRDVDLNDLRDRVIRNQNNGDTRPTNSSKTVTTDREGNISVGNNTDGQTGPVSTIPQETFAARMEEDRRTANTYLPSNTREITTKEGVTGFAYSFNTEYGDRYTLFAFFDGSNYQVQVVSPEVEDRFNSPHTGHIFSDGKICFGNDYGCGMPSLKDAFSKSVLWANGMSVAVRTGKFPFSNNN